MPPDAAAGEKLVAIAERLDRIRGSIRGLFLLDGCARLLAAVCAFVIVTFVLDYFFILPGQVRVVFLLAGLALFSWIAARRIAYPAAVRISDDDLALFVERHYPELNDRLISAIQLARSAGHEEDVADRVAGFNSPELVHALIDDASSAAASLNFNRVIVRAHVLRIAAWAGAIALVIGAAAVATEKSRRLAGIYVQRALGLATRWPQRTYLHVLHFDPQTREKTIARGDDLTIAVEYDGVRPGKVRLFYTFATGEHGRETMTETAMLAGPFAYAGGVLSREVDAAFEDAWPCARLGLKSLGMPVLKEDEKAVQLESLTADKQPVRVTVAKLAAKKTRIAVQAGAPDTPAGRDAAQAVHDAITKELSGRGGGMYIYTFTHVPGPFEFTVEGNDDRTDPFRVLTKNPPSIEEMRLFYQYPDYLKMQNTPEDQPVVGGNITAPQYTSVRFVAVGNEDITEATLRLGAKGKEKDSPLALLKDKQGAERLITGTITVDEAYSEYQLLLKAKNGLPNRDPIRYTIKGHIDARPTIHVYDPPGEENVTEICERPITAEVRDDNGVAEIFFEYCKDGKISVAWTPVKMGAEHMKPTEYGPGVKSIKIEYLFNIAPLQAVPGEYVRFRFRAADYKDIGGERNVTIGKEYRLAVVQLTQLEKELQDALEKVKQNLEQLRRRQNSLYENTARLDKKFGAIDKLSPEQAGEVKYASHEQSSITDKIDQSKRDIDRIRLRGQYNKIFDARAAAELEKAAEALQIAIAPPQGPSPVATGLLRDAAREQAQIRSRMLNDARGFQSQVLTAIDNALRFLDRWSSYQEIVRLVRFALDMQQQVIKQIQEGHK